MANTLTYDKLINDDIFLELVWDCTAWAVWQYFEVPDKKKGGYREIPGTDMNYSGDFPIWRLAYVMLPYLRQKFETNGLSFQSLFNMTPDMEVPYFSYLYNDKVVITFNYKEDTETINFSDIEAALQACADGSGSKFDSSLLLHSQVH